MDYKIILGYLAAAIGVFSSAIYFWQVVKNKVKPHAFSWLIWSLVAGLGFFAQIVKHGGAGAWVTGVTAVACVIICVLAFYKGGKIFTIHDWWFLCSALFACLLWWLTKDPTLSVILAALTNSLGMIPTLRQAYFKASQESLSYFSMAVLKWVLGLFALQAYNIATWLYPAALLLANLCVVIVLLFRRKNLTTIK